VAIDIAMLELSSPASTPASAACERDVVGQIKLAFAHPLPLMIGALIGALVPIATYTVGHAELGEAGWASLPGAIVIGGCGFSAITVYKWGRRAFDSALKAAGFVVLAEGAMSFSHTPWLSLVVLGFLVAINAIANGANLAVAHLDAEARRTAAIAVAPGVAAASLEADLLAVRLDRLEAELVRVATATATATATPAPALPPTSEILALPASAGAAPDAAVGERVDALVPVASEKRIPARRRTGTKTTKASRARRAPDVVN
jgi:hypothetical protein